ITGFSAAIYSAIRFLKATSRARIALGLGAIALGGTALSLVQIWSGVQEWGEMVRGPGLTYEAASAFSFVPENFFTFITPTFLGDLVQTDYWGRWHLWEMCFFVGVCGLILAMASLFWSKSHLRGPFAVMIIVILILALGKYTPLFR